MPVFFSIKSIQLISHHHSYSSAFKYLEILHHVANVLKLLLRVNMVNWKHCTANSLQDKQLLTDKCKRPDMGSCIGSMNEVHSQLLESISIGVLVEISYSMQNNK